MLWESISKLPELRRFSEVIAFIRELFPEPEGPMRATCSPELISNEQCSKALIEPKLKVASVNFIIEMIKLLEWLTTLTIES